jgi:hypothetical protein
LWTQQRTTPSAVDRRVKRAPGSSIVVRSPFAMGPSSTLRAEAPWSSPVGSARKVELGPIAKGERTTIELPGARFTLRSTADGVVRCCVHNTAEVASGLDRRGALARSLISVHLLVQIEGGLFLSPLDVTHDSVNTFPVLATPQDDVILGAAIVLPDHPQIAPESRGSLFDGTEIEEALLLHVQVLSDGEREEIAAADPAVREMIDRAFTASPEQILALHGRVTVRDPREGEQAATVDDVTFLRGCKLRLRPSPDADLHARMLDGRTATLERILIDYDGRTHLGVTIDGDPGQELMRETGRLLYFFSEEVEVVER